MEGFEKNFKIENSRKELTPKGWSLLTHGSNLEREQWSGEKMKQLDEDILVVKGMGLSVVGEMERISDDEKEKSLHSAGVTSLGYDTTKTYSLGEGETLIINVISPSYGERSQPEIFKDQKRVWRNKCGETRAEEIAKFVNAVHHLNNPRHPQFSSGTRLFKVKDEITARGREITYVPEALRDIYELEMLES